jgi:hypothetical protein
MSRVYILTIVGSELNLTADFVRAEINNRRSYLNDSFITIPELSIKQLGIIDSTLEVRLLPNDYGSFYEIALFDINDNELLRCFFIMPDADSNLHELRLLTAYPEVTSIATSFLALSDTPNSYLGQAGKMVAVKADESGLEFIEGCTGEPPIEIPLGCEGSVDHITVGVITDGGLIEVYLNDVLLEVETNFFFRIGGAAEKLRMHGIDVTALTAQGLPALDHGGGRYYEAEQAAFSNTTSNYQKIRIKTIDANAVDQNHTPENESFDSESEPNTTTFCLAPQSGGISCAGATNSFKYVLAIRNNTTPQPDALRAIVDGVMRDGNSPPILWLDEQILPEDYPFPVPSGFSVGHGIARTVNSDSSNHRIEFKSNSDDLLIFIYDNPTVIQLGDQPNRHVGVCLAPPSNLISCAGAIDTLHMTGLWGTYNVYVNGQLSLENAFWSSIEQHLLESHSISFRMVDEIHFIIKNLSGLEVRLRFEGVGENGTLQEHIENQNPTLIINNSIPEFSFCLSPLVMPACSTVNQFSINNTQVNYNENSVMCLAFRANGNVESVEIPVQQLSEFYNTPNVKDLIPYFFLRDMLSRGGFYGLRGLTLDQYDVDASSVCTDGLVSGEAQFMLNLHGLRTKFITHYAAYDPNASKTVRFTIVKNSGEKVELAPFVGAPTTDEYALASNITNHFATEFNKLAGFSATVYVGDYNSVSYTRHQLRISFTAQHYLDTIIVVGGEPNQSMVAHPEDHIWYSLSMAGGWGGADIKDSWKGECSIGSYVQTYRDPDPLPNPVHITGEFNEMNSSYFVDDPKTYTFDSYANLGLQLPPNGIDFFAMQNYQAPIEVKSCGYMNMPS